MRAERARLWMRLSAVLWLAFGSALLLARDNSGQENQENDSETVIVDKKFHNREIKVRNGAVIRVNLEELGAAGYEWKIQSLDGEYFEILDFQSPSTPSPDALAGAPVAKTWLIRSQKEGQSEMRFIHYRPWEDVKSASDTFVLNVRIVP